MVRTLSKKAKARALASLPGGIGPELERVQAEVQRPGANLYGGTGLHPAGGVGMVYPRYGTGAAVTGSPFQGLRGPGGFSGWGKDASWKGNPAPATTAPGPYGGGKVMPVGMGGGGATGAPAATGGILDAYNQAQEEARQANLQRYENLLGQGAWRYGEGMNLVNQLGGARATEINRQFGNRLSAQEQDLAARGLSSSTVLPTMQMASDREKQRALNELNEQITGQRLGVHTGISGDISGVMERRTDTYPNPAALYGLMQQYGQARTQQPTGGGFVNPNAYGNLNPLGFQTPMPMMGYGTGGGYGGGGGAQPAQQGNPFLSPTGRYRAPDMYSAPPGGSSPYSGQDINWLMPQQGVTGAGVYGTYGAGPGVGGYLTDAMKRLLGIA